MTADPEASERLDPESAEAELYAEHVARYQFALSFAARKRVLDCATGVGYGAALLADVAHLVVGVDNAPEAIREASRRYARPNVRYLVADGQSLPLQSQSIDLVISLETIEHAIGPDRFLAEFRRVLTPSGVLILSTPNTDVYRYEDGVENPFHPHEFTIDELSELLRRYFTCVTLLAERHQTSVLIGPSDTAPMVTWFGDQRKPRADVIQRSPYVVAVCSNTPIRPTGLVRFASGGSRMQELVAWARTGEQDLGRARKRMQDLEEELAERTKWAQELDGELAHARSAVSDLQRQIAERTRWAQQVDTELEKARGIIERLESEVESRTRWAHQLEAELSAARQLPELVPPEPNGP
jgi:SAM-dependent methyltransferase